MKLSAEVLIEAYRLGFFPMASSRDSGDVMWVRPEFRGIFPLDQFRVSRSLAKILRQDRFQVTINKAFAEVMAGCAESTPGREETWINDEITKVYGDLHRAGGAHSVECWQDGKLVGGLYGVSLRGAFFGESMFSRASNASKVALCHLVGRLKLSGYSLLDTQFLTDHLASLGAVEVPEAEYQLLLAEALKGSGDFRGLPPQMPGSSIWQAITQTS